MLREGLQGGQESREEAGEEARGADLWRGPGGWEGGGGWAGALGIRPTPTAPAFLQNLAWLSCSRSREILARPCTLGRGAWIARQMGTRTQLEKHSRESRGQSRAVGTDVRAEGSQASEALAEMGRQQDRACSTLCDPRASPRQLHRKTKPRPGKGPHLLVLSERREQKERISM